MVGIEVQLIFEPKPVALITCVQPEAIDTFGPAVGFAIEVILNKEVVGCVLEKVRMCGPAPVKQTAEPTFIAGPQLIL